ncbi:MAG: hypothetical protein M0Z46_16125 [Actinomycetota bacterium]|nr:hypothetical protein [Actinomycetota bacterium]
MLHQPWTTASKLAAQRSSDLSHLAASRRRRSAPRAEGKPGTVALAAGRALVAAGWRLGGDGALPPPAVPPPAVPPPARRRAA